MATHVAAADHCCCSAHEGHLWYDQQRQSEVKKGNAVVVRLKISTVIGHSCPPKSSAKLDPGKKKICNETCVMIQTVALWASLSALHAVVVRLKSTHVTSFARSTKIRIGARMMDQDFEEYIAQRIKRIHVVMRLGNIRVTSFATHVEDVIHLWSIKVLQSELFKSNYGLRALHFDNITWPSRCLIFSLKFTIFSGICKQILQIIFQYKN